MNESSYAKICDHASFLNLDLGTQELAQFILEHNFDDGQIEAIRTILDHLAENKRKNIISTLLKMSRLPLKDPKTFDNFDYSRLQGKQIDALRELSNLATLYAQKNLAFIGPPGVGKTHLAMAYGRLCCEKGFEWFSGKRIDNPNTHGTGCTLSSAIASNLAKGFSLSESIGRAKEYISGALAAQLDLGKGSGPMAHAFDLHSMFADEK